MPKVSVIVPAYAPGDGLDRVVTSLDAQTMPADDFELIVVDDGSPDDTWERLVRVRDSHRNVRIEQIPNSGWPSTPRNVGIDMAQGDYVLFMDHDDSLYPDGLRASYEFAARHGADVLSPKQLKTSNPSWGLDDFAADMPNAIDKRGINSLLPMMPHKLYRRAFLLEHGIRFPEGRRRLWEDVYFNVECFRHAKVISILSSTPVYLWQSTDSNNSATYGPWEEQFWDRLEEMLEFIDQTLPGPEWEAARTTQILHHYRSRLLGRIASYVASGDRKESWDLALRRAHALIDRFVPVELDRKLAPMAKVRSALLRAGELKLLAMQTRSDAIRPVSVTEAVEWRDGSLGLTVATRWLEPDGSPLRLQGIGDQVHRAVRPEVAGVLGADSVDVTAAVKSAKSVVTVRRRSDYVTWAVRGTTDVTIERLAPYGGRVTDGGAEVTPVVRVSTSVDLATAALGGPLGPGVWDLKVQSSVAGARGHRPLDTATSARPFASGAGYAVAYRSKRGALTLDTAAELRNVVDDGRLRLHEPPETAGRLSPTVAGTLDRVVAGVPGSHPVEVRWVPTAEQPSDGRWSKALRLFGRRKAEAGAPTTTSGTLTIDGKSVRLVLEAPQAEARYRGQVILNGILTKTAILVSVTNRGCEKLSVASARTGR